MKPNKFTAITLVTLSLCMLSACSDDDQRKAKQSATDFIEQVKRSLPFQEKTEQPKKTAAISYETQELKSPFRSVIAEQKRTGPMVLTSTPLNDIRIIGIVLGKDKKWAIVSDSSKQLHAVAPGFHLGKENATVNKITSNSVELAINPGSDSTNSSIVTLKIKE